MSGAMGLTGFPGTPVRSIVSWVDYGTALHGAFGAMVALYDRQKTGRGRLIDVSLLATGVMFMDPLLAELVVTGVRREQLGNTAFYTSPSDAYRTTDGWIMVPTIGDDMFRRWAKMVGREDLIDDSRLADDISRANNHQLITETMSAWCASRSREQALTELEEARIPAGPVYSLEEVTADVQVRERGLLEELEYPGAGRPVPLAATPVRLSETNGRIRHRPPLLGEHTDQILGELGFTPEDINRFRDIGAI
jgi:crotonobetainyl-CoA:carnitine CoA-transferase CaiB-like acyl-CoA transferase